LWLVLLGLLVILATVLLCSWLGMIGLVPAVVGESGRSMLNADYSPWERNVPLIQLDIPRLATAASRGEGDWSEDNLPFLPTATPTPTALPPSATPAPTDTPAPTATDTTHNDGGPPPAPTSGGSDDGSFPTAPPNDDGGGDNGGGGGDDDGGNGGGGGGGGDGGGGGGGGGDDDGGCSGSGVCP
jgi:hypothetical protein